MKKIAPTIPHPAIVKNINESLKRIIISKVPHNKKLKIEDNNPTKKQKDTKITIVIHFFVIKFNCIFPFLSNCKLDSSKTETVDQASYRPLYV